jgi:predicted ATPase
MLKRIYIDNYKSLVNFDQELGPINLFLGPNGSGKSTVFEVLRKIRSIVNGDSRVNDEFKFESRTCWQTTLIQNFELEIVKDDHTYRYALSIEYSEKDQTAHIKQEHLWLDGNPLLKVEAQQALLYKEDHSEGSSFPFDWTRSVIDFIPLYNPWITRFKGNMNEILIVQIDPRSVKDASDRDEPYPSQWIENYASWYRYLSKDQGWVIELTEALKDVLPGFEYFRFVDAGEKVSILKSVFSSQGTKPASKMEFRFDELSDGQRALIILYTLLIAARKENYVLCIDEPENFLALPEIQPWLIALYDLCMDGKAQGLIISHHPEMINYLLASPVGYWFERQENQATRVKPIIADKNGGLSISELIARGWLNE